MPAPVVARSGFYSSVFEQTVQNVPYLLVPDNICDKNPDNIAAIFCNGSGRLAAAPLFPITLIFGVMQLENI